MSTTTRNINDTFFKGSYKEVWRKLMPPALTMAECDFIIDIADLKEGDKVADIMCGYGRHAIELGRRGISVTAVDNLAEYVQEIIQNVTAEKLPVHAVKADVLEVDLRGDFDAIICMGNSFAFFDREDAVSLLKNMSGHLAAGGKLIIGTWMIAEIAIRHFKEREWRQVEDIKYLIENQFLFYPARIESEHSIIRNDGTGEVIEGIDYIFTLSELEEMFAAAGLTTGALYTTPRKKKFAIGDATIYIVAEKK